MLEEAKHHCDFLIVGLQNDPTFDRPDTKNPPVQSLIERQIQLSAVKYVDEIVVYNTEQDLCDLLLTLPIDIRILGVEYSESDFTGKSICQQRGIELFFNKRYSGTDLSDNPDFVRIAEAYDCKGVRVTKPDEVKPVLEEAFASPEVWVIDCIIDREENVFPMVPAGEALNRMIGGMA